MFQFNSSSYDAMLGAITKDFLSASLSCIGQCTGCMCSCRCSCSGGFISDFEWEVK